MMSCQKRESHRFPSHNNNKCLPKTATEFMQTTVIVWVNYLQFFTHHCYIECTSVACCSISVMTPSVRNGLLSISAFWSKQMLGWGESTYLKGSLNKLFINLLNYVSLASNSHFHVTAFAKHLHNVIPSLKTSTLDSTSNLSGKESTYKMLTHQQ